MKIVHCVFVQIVQAVSRETHWLEKSWLLCCSNFHNRNTCIQQTKSVPLLVAIVLHGAYRKCISLCGFIITTSGACICHCRRKVSNLLILASAIVSYSANNFFLFVGASKNTGGSSGLPLGVPSDIHHGQNSPYHPLCIVGNTFTATRPADLRGAWCVHLVLQTTEGKLAKIVNGQKRLATYHTTKAGLQESINVYLSLVSSMTATCLKSQLSLKQLQSFKVAIHNHL